MTELVRACKGAALLALIPIAIGLLVVAVGSNSQVRVLNFFLINLIIVIGLQIFMGNSKVVNFGHITFMGIAGYTSAILTMPLAAKSMTIPDAPFGLAELQIGALEAAVIAVLFACILALVVGIVIARESGISATILSIALLIIFHTIFVNWIELTRGMRALFAIPVKTNVWLLLIATSFVILIARVFRESALGVQLRASAESRLAAESMGVNVRALRLIAWVLSAAVVALGGVFYVHLVGSISPKSFYFETTFLTLAMLILGGMNSVSGAVVGAIVVTVGFEIVRYFEMSPIVFGIKLPEFLGLTGFFLGLTIILVMALRPQGLVGADEFDEIWRNRRRQQKKESGETRLREP